MGKHATPVRLTGRSDWMKRFLSHIDQIGGDLRKRLGLRRGAVRLSSRWRGYMTGLAEAGVAMMVGGAALFRGLTFTAAELADDAHELRELEEAQGRLDAIGEDLTGRITEVRNRIAERVTTLHDVVTAAQIDPRATEERAAIEQLARPFLAIIEAGQQAMLATRAKTLQKKASAEDAVAAVSAERDTLAIENKVLRGEGLAVRPQPAAARLRRKARR